MSEVHVCKKLKIIYVQTFTILFYSDLLLKRLMING